MVLLEPGAHFALHRLNHQWLAPLGPGKCFFGRFLLRLGRIKSSQVMSMVKFGPEALNFGYDFVILVHFFGTPCMYICVFLYFCLLVDLYLYLALRARGQGLTVASDLTSEYLVTLPLKNSSSAFWTLTRPMCRCANCCPV